MTPPLGGGTDIRYPRDPSGKSHLNTPKLAIFTPQNDLDLLPSRVAERQKGVHFYVFSTLFLEVFLA